jgi:signal transduction histidine kinase/CheY-like chemotaxis protein
MQNKPNATSSGDGVMAAMQVDFTLLQRSTVLLAMPGLFAAALILGTIGAQTAEYIWAITSALLLIALIPLIWLISRRSFVLASVLLVLGSLAGVTLVLTWGGIPEALPLFLLPAGLAMVCFGTLAGVPIGLGLSFLFILAPGPFSAVSPALRVVSGIGIWAVIGLVWLTLRPLISAVDWSWQAYAEGRRLLEQSREFQVRLQQALEDLTQANGQLNRLNALANNLRRAAEEERRIKEQFVANVSHELRTPLNMVIGFSEMILKTPDAYAGENGQKLPARLLADLQVVLRNSQHLSSLIDDVLDLSQIEAGQMALVKEPVEIGEVVEAAATAVRPLFDSKHLYLDYEVEAGLPPVYCDRTRIREVLLNLLSNAGRFTSQGGVRLRAWRETGSVVFSVQDTGPGISPQDREKLFQPFQQLDPSIRRKHGGTGLGLSISKSFVELHDGKMWVESEEGQGTTFFFRLPVEAPESAQSGFQRWVNPYMTYEKRTRPPYHPEIDRRPRVMIVESGAILRRLLGRYLPGVDLVAAQDLMQVREMLEQSPARMVIVNQPPGEPFADDLLQPSLPDETPLLMVCVADPVYYAPAPGVPEMLVKPISQEALVAALDKVALGKTIQSVLLVEDDEDAQKLFVRMLDSTGRGYRVARAGNGAQALRLLERRQFDVILLDLIMPVMDGYQFLRARADSARLQQIPVVLISAQDTRGHPIISRYLAAARPGGISVQQLLDSLQALSAILSPGASRPGEPEA